MIVGKLLMAHVLTSLLDQASPVLAYLGPGAGLSTIGAFLAVVAGIIVALFGFVWYPIRRLLRKRKPRDEGQGEAGE